jgi:hypothetical protein
MRILRPIVLPDGDVRACVVPADLALDLDMMGTRGESAACFYGPKACRFAPVSRALAAVRRMSRRSPEKQGLQRFLTLDGHRRIFTLTSLIYFRC